VFIVGNPGNRKTCHPNVSVSAAQLSNNFLTLNIVCGNIATTEHPCHRKYSLIAAAGFLHDGRMLKADMEEKVGDKSNGAEAKLRKRLVLYFELHLCTKLSTVHEQPGSEFNPVDVNETRKETELWVHDVYNPVNEMLMQLISASPDVKIALAISGHALEMLAQHAPVALQSLTKLNESGAIEWIALPYNNSISVLISREAYSQEVIRHKELLYKHFGVEASILLSTPFFEPSIPELGSAMGFKGLIVKPESWPGQSVVFDETNNISLLGTDRDIPDAVTHHFGAGRSAMRVDDLIAMMNDTRDEICVVGFSSGIFQIHQRSGIYSILSDFITQAALDQKLLHPSDVIGEEDTYRLPRLIMKPASDVTAWLGNEVQKEALASAKELDALSNDLVDESYRIELMQLLAADHFLNMSSRATRLTNPYLSPAEVFNNYMKALTNLKRRMQGAQTRDDDQPAKTVEAERQHITTPVWVLQEQTKYKEVSHPPL
jgi:alpha-amylase